MQKSITSTQGFFVKRKYNTRNYKSVNVKYDSKTSETNRPNAKT